MSDKSAIEWTEATWNPTTGCTKVSPGCANCYIERTPPFRIAGRRFVKGHIPLQLHADRLDAPLHWRKPRRVFVNSLSDLFHEDVPDSFIDRVFAVMALAPRHTFQILTKRAERMRVFFTEWRPERIASWMPQGREHVGFTITRGLKLDEREPSRCWPLPNVWLGVSVENQHFADERIPLLLRTPAAVRFLSAEPLLECLDLAGLRGGTCDALSGRDFESIGDIRDGGVLSKTDDPPGLDWVIVGGESGPRPRPTDPAWVRSIRDQCQVAGVPFFFKQWGGKTAKAGGRLLDGRTWDEMP